VAEAENRLTHPDLGKVWHHLRHARRLKDAGVVHRGIEWIEHLTEDGKETGWRDILVQPQEFKNSKRGIPPRAKPFYAFEKPPTAYLDVSAEHRRGNAHEYDWEADKVILNAKTKSRGPWRIAAFADTEGLVCYQTFTAVWPSERDDLLLLTAVLNGPIANAYVTAHEGKTDITNETIEEIPLPSASSELRADIERLYGLYLQSVEKASEEFFSNQSKKEATEILRSLDAALLTGYDLPPRLERMLLDYFGDSKRTTRFPFRRYFPASFKPCFSLQEYISAEFQLGTAGEFRRNAEPPPPGAIEALRRASGIRG
jgi:hypothetical protein